MRTTRSRVLFIWVTSAGVPRVDHAVTDEEMAAAVRTGRHRSVCETTFLAASLMSPPLPKCTLCLGKLGIQVAANPAPRPGRIARLVRRAV